MLPNRTLALAALAAPAALALALAAASPARAQIAPGGPGEPDTPISPAERAAVVESLAANVERRYVFPDRAAALAKLLRRRAAAHAYDRIASSRELADTLLAQVQAATHDLHMRVHYRYEPIPEASADSIPESERLRQHEFERVRNFGFEKVQRLPGNVGYLDLRSFSGDPDAQAVAVAAMNFLANTDAIIVDLRRNGGGDPAMIQTLLSYFVRPGDRLHINDFYLREGDRTEQFWSSPYVPGPRLAGKPLHVLVSNLTGSAAEEFAYDVQTHALGSLWGATTAGAANPGGMVRLNAHLAAFIANGRAVNPKTKTNWEGVGVRPGHDVPPAEALRAAHVEALHGLLAAAADDEAKARLKRALEQAQQAPLDPADDFVRRGARR